MGRALYYHGQRQGKSFLASKLQTDTLSHWWHSDKKYLNKEKLLRRRLSKMNITSKQMKCKYPDGATHIDSIGEYWKFEDDKWFTYLSPVTNGKE